MKTVFIKFDAEAEKNYIHARKITTSFDENTQQLLISGYMVLPSTLENVPTVRRHVGNNVEEFKWSTQRTPMLKKRFPSALNGDRARLSVKSQFQGESDLWISIEQNGSNIPLASIFMEEEPDKLPITAPKDLTNDIEALKAGILAYRNFIRKITRLKDLKAPEYDIQALTFMANCRFRLRHGRTRSQIFALSDNLKKKSV